MKRLSYVFVLFLVTSFVPSAATADRQGADARHSDSRSAFMRIYGPTSPPQGYVAFCRKNPRKCLPGTRTVQRPVLTTDRLVELDEVNRLVNDAIAPMTDQEIYGVSEYWTLPVSRGDCEDYALLKRQILMSRGWPKSSLLLTVVRDENGAGHAVLTVRTAQGDFIADNKNSEILNWQKTPYQYVMRQSYLNQQNWMRLGPKRHGAARSRSGSNR